ncbi:MAG: FhaA domain-containing protein, partial [Acidimicrobiia bacterium]
MREADLAVIDGPAGPTVPNHYLLRLHPTELATAEAHDILLEQLAAVVEETATTRGWRLDGPAVVEIESLPSVVPGSIECETSIRQGRLRAWAHLIELNDQRRLSIRHNRALLGRSEQADIRLEEAAVSRFHALLWRETGQAWVVDLGSSNGTLLNGGRVRDAQSLQPGDALTFGVA